LLKSVQQCTGCRAILSEEQVLDARGSCPYCGRKLASAPTLDSEIDDPYAPPIAASAEPLRLDVPAGMWGKIGMAFRLFAGQLPLFTALVLTVWIPVNLAIELALAQNPNANDPLITARVSSLAELVFGPICAGSIITALAGRMGGQRVSYAAAMRAGLHHWGRLFSARFVAGLIVGLGLIALVIPGIILAVRFSLIDEVVVLEGEGASGSRSRSTSLTTGRRWSVFCGGTVVLMMMLLLIILISGGLELGGLPDNPWVAVGVDCVFDIISVLLTCLLFVYYWEAREQEHRQYDTESIDLNLNTRF
jgi:hypothetical protein